MTTDKEQELKPCLSCGKQPELIYDQSSDYESHWYYEVRCLNQKCPQMWRQDPKDAIEAWNTRAEQHPSREMVSELKKLIESGLTIDDIMKHYETNS